jgi:hypothetical protein
MSSVSVYRTWFCTLSLIYRSVYKTVCTSWNAIAKRLTFKQEETRAEFLRVFLHASNSHLYLRIFLPPSPFSKSGLKLVCNVNIVYGNLKSVNSQDYAHKPQRNCTFMNSASGYNDKQSYRIVSSIMACNKWFGSSNLFFPTLHFIWGREVNALTTKSWLFTLSIYCKSRKKPQQYHFSPPKIS